jgi:hypothetical protein
MEPDRRASDDLLLQLVREGQHDAEIAVRLGITTGALRERKTDLRNRLGDQRYLALTGRLVAKRQRRWPWAAGGAAVALGSLLLMANLLDSGEEATSEGSAKAVTAARTNQDLERPATVTVDGREFEDLGQFVTNSKRDGNAISSVSNRAALVVVELRGTTYLVGSTVVDWGIVSSSRTDAFLRGTMKDRQIDLAVYTQKPQVRLRPVEIRDGPFLEASPTDSSGIPRLLIRATEGARPLEALLTEAGHLLIAHGPIDSSWVIDGATGARLDVTGARAFGTVSTSSSGSWFNGCDGTGEDGTKLSRVHCRVSWQRGNSGFTVPVDGTYGCAGARSVVYEGAGVRLTFILAGTSTSASFACQPSPVAAGASIVPDGEWIVTAATTSNEPLSVAFAGDGTEYVGEMRGDVSGPGLPQP